MTGGITHYERPLCDFPQEDSQPCHGAIFAIVADYWHSDDVQLLACDLHGVSFLEQHGEAVTKVDILNEKGEGRAWWHDNDESKGPDVQRAISYGRRAFVDHGCCVYNPEDHHEFTQGAAR